MKKTKSRIGMLAAGTVVCYYFFMKQKFESVPQEKLEEEFEMLTGKEKFEIVLKLFGAKAARDSFVETCKKYAALRSVILPDSHGENYVPRGRTHSPPQRANLHNQIMETLKHLSLQKLNPLPEKVLREMASREIAGQVIKEWVAAQDHVDDEDEQERKKRDTSGPAYFHSLGREH